MACTYHPWECVRAIGGGDLGMRHIYFNGFLHIIWEVTGVLSPVAHRQVPCTIPLRMINLFCFCFRPKAGVVLKAYTSATLTDHL